MNYQVKKSHKTFAGTTHFAEHESQVIGGKMNFSYFLPPSEKPKHGIVWLSGLTCTEENFMAKAGAQKILAEKEALIICPDTSPRGLDLPGEHDSYDFGSGAGFYVNALTEGYKDSYRMYDYIKNEVVALAKGFGVSRLSIMGHSMGGHGALVLGLREPDTFSKVSAFSPIVNPIQCPWGVKAFTGYLGEDRKDLWKTYDACELVSSGHQRNEILIDQGTNDEFFAEQLLTSNFESACKESGQALKVNYRESYDHSYYFISSFIQSHIEFHLS